MAVIKPKFIYNSEFVTEWANYAKLELSSRDFDGGDKLDLPTSSLGGMEGYLSRSVLYFHQDFDITQVTNDLATDSYELAYKGIGKTINLIADKYDRSFFPRNPDGGDVHLFYTLQTNGLSDIEFERPENLRKKLLLGTVNGINPAEWCNAGTTTSAGSTSIGTNTLNDSVIPKTTTNLTKTSSWNTILKESQSFAPLDNINTRNYLRAVHDLATCQDQEFKNTSIAGQYALAVDYLKGKGTKTNAEQLNQLLKLYQKAYLNTENICYRNTPIYGTVSGQTIIGYTYKTNNTSYVLAQNGDEIDDWVTTNEYSILNGEREDDSSANWTETTTIDETSDSSALINPSRSLNIKYNFNRTDNNEDETWTGTRGSNNSSYTVCPDTIYFLPHRIFNGSWYGSSFVSDQVRNKDIKIYAEIHIQVLLHGECSNDSFTAITLNDDLNGFITEQKRSETEIQYDDFQGDPQTEIFIGRDEEIAATTLYNQKHIVNISKVVKDAYTYNQKLKGYESASDLADRRNALGIFNGETNPFGYLQITGCYSKFNTMINGFIPSIPRLPYQEPSLKTYDNVDLTRTFTKGEDHYIFSFSGNIEFRTTQRIYQEVEGRQVTLLDGAFDSFDLPFDYSSV